MKSKLDWKHGCAITMTMSAITAGLLIGTLKAEESQLERLGESLSDPSKAARIANELQDDPNIRVLDVLLAMKNRSEVAKNWYLSVAQSIADRDPERSEVELQQFLSRASEDPAARYWAFTYVTRDKPQLRESILESMLADPSLDLRYEAVKLAMRRLEKAEGMPSEQKLIRYRELLQSARLPEQVQEIAERLEELGSPVDLLDHFGFVAEWKLVGTFENSDQQAFDVAYGPEQDYAAGKLGFEKKYVGKTGEAIWLERETTAEDGAVDLNPVFENAKGAIAYAYGEFTAASDIDCQIRIGSPNACKVWVNGELAVSREVYHSGNQIDQYVEPVKLREGKNSILVKVCQNEQTEPWAQDWLFQLRFTDASGLAIQPAR